MKNKFLFLMSLYTFFVISLHSNFLLPSLSSNSKTIIALGCVYACYDFASILCASQNDEYERSKVVWEYSNVMQQPTELSHQYYYPPNWDSLNESDQLVIKKNDEADYVAKYVQYEHDNQKFVNARKLIVEFSTAESYASSFAWQTKKSLIIKQVIAKPLLITLIGLCVTKYFF